MSKRVVFLIAVTIICSFNLSYALQLEIIYPRPESNLPSVDSTFIFGNAEPGSRVLINGRLIPVHEGGGFLGFVDVSDGEFIFEVTAIDGVDTAIVEVPVIIGTAKVNVPPDSLYIYPGSELPVYEMSVPADELIEIGFKGSAGCTAFYSTALDTLWHPLYDGFYDSLSTGSVFGEISAGGETDLVNYRRYVKARDLADTALSFIKYKLESSDGNELVVSSREKIALIDSELRIVEFTGKAEIVRSARQAGYVLLYQPPGVRAVYDGYEGGYTRIKLAENLTGFVPADSVVILPEGTRKPSSRIRYLRAEDHPEYTELRVPLREPLPYQIRQELNPSRMNIFIYGGIGDTDWIKYVPMDGAVELVRWYQQADGVYALSLELKDDWQWGYSHGYDGNTFTLGIKKRPAYGGFLQSEVKGLRVVIDPGHCPDTGAVGPTGLLEKDINLWISHKLRKILEKNGAEVIQTRYGHEPVDIYERP
ncbi:MAG: hypothetical protein GF307_11640, partial [candidate division Zixibacteria bacterium]|nr:hypothetical protein [candidate division Zixibacteria bacterium]